MIDFPVTKVRERSKHRSLNEAKALVAEWKSSVVGPKRWCADHAAHESTLASCRRRVESMTVPCQKITNFIELLPKVPVPARVRLSITPSGAAVEVSLADLARVIQLLGGTSA